jgi:phage tail sheath protein FI
VAPALPAIVTGTETSPFSLSSGDTLTVTVNAAAATVTVQAAPAELETANGPFDFSALLAPATPTLPLRVRVGTGPEQTVTFTGAAISDPGKQATAAEVVSVLAPVLTGVKVFADGAKVVLRTDVEGIHASLTVTAGIAQTQLGLPTTTENGAGNVPDVSKVTVQDLVTLFGAPPDFTVGEDSGHHLRLQATVAGPLTLTVAGTAAAKLGLPASGTGGGGGSSGALTVQSYDSLAGTVTFTGALTNDLDPNEVYAVIGGKAPSTTQKGPTFYARSPGAWSENLSIAITSTDRSPVQVTAAAAATATALQVQNTSSFYVGAVVEVNHDNATRSYHEVTAITGKALTVAPNLGAAVSPGTSTARVLEIDVAISDDSGAAPTEVYRGLSWNQGGARADLKRHYAAVINPRSRLVFVKPPDKTNEGPLPSQQPTTLNGFSTRLTTPGQDNFGGLTDDDYIGEDKGPGSRTGLQAFRDVTDISIIAAPGKTSAAVQQALIAQCENLRYRFAILDGERDPLGGAVSEILKHRSLYDTSYAAYYQPWLGVTLGGETRYLPPSGFMAGLYARVDNARGVWKAPANEVILNVTSLKTNFTTGEQDILNPRGVNLIRRFEQGGIRAWGGRTVSSDPELKYINVRRTLIFLEASIDRGTQWVVFEPNTPDTWTRVTESLSSFLQTQWRAGALFGRTSDDAFFVRCDESTMTADDVQNGRLICRIGLALVRPAEFVIFQIEQLTGFAKQ